MPVDGEGAKRVTTAIDAAPTALEPPMYCARPLPLAPRALWAAPMLAAALLSACGAEPFEGEFQGTCAVGEGESAIAVPIEFTVIEGDEGELLGFGAFRFNDYTFTGEAVGARADGYVMVDLQGVAGGYTIGLRVVGEANDEGTSVDGRCGFIDQGDAFVGTVKMIAPKDDEG